VAFTPDRGHVIWVSFTPQAGHEQAGRRPAIVVSPRAYNSKVGLLLACPITNQAKGYPFEVVIPPGLPVSGVVLSDQLRSIDWRARNAALICSAPVEVIEDTLAKAITLLQP
jgi:mRNA interferase MazF